MSVNQKNSTKINLIILRYNGRELQLVLKIRFLAFSTAPSYIVFQGVKFSLNALVGHAWNCLIWCSLKTTQPPKLLTSYIIDFYTYVRKLLPFHRAYHRCCQWEIRLWHVLSSFGCTGCAGPTPPPSWETAAPTAPWTWCSHRGGAYRKGLEGLWGCARGSSPYGKTLQKIKLVSKAAQPTYAL